MRRGSTAASIIEQLIRCGCGLFAEDHRHSVVCEQRVHELAIFFLAFGVKVVNAV
jgi:hypothetical protein